MNGIYLHSHLVLKLHWEKEMEKVGGQLLKPLSTTKTIKNTNTTNSTNKHQGG